MEESVPPGSVCCFCLSSHEDEALYGKFYKIEEITTHYFCLLLSSKVQQRGSDDEGILGFLAKDIRNEVRRGKNLVCAYCHKRGATISCHNSKCKLHFHLPCGRAKDTFHQFFGEFKSFCFKHRKSQSIKKEVLKAMSGKQSTCSICLESVPATPSPNTLWAPCCSKEAWFHRLCIQRLALSAGYFFKCPLCNNTNRFVESMRTCGIWIPEQDASWERDPNRYDGLLQRHNSCDAKSCRCKQGRTFHMENTKWEIKLCADCGSQGMHVHCGNLRVTQDWVCAICANVLTSKKEEEQNKPGKILLSRQAIRARNRARRGLPGRPARRLTRLQQLHASEDGEEEERETDKMAAITAPPSPGLIKGASSSQKSTPSAPQKEAPRPIKPTASKSMQQELIPQTVQRASENSDVEIIDVGDDSDDEVQQWGCKKNAPFVCTCKRKSRWSWHVRKPFGSRVSSCCYERSKKHMHNGQSRTPRIKDSENDLISRFFSTLASCSESPLQKNDPQCHHLLWIRHYQVGCSAERSHCSNGFETSNVVNNISSDCTGKKTPSRASWSRKRSLSTSYEEGTCHNIPLSKKVKSSSDSKAEVECPTVQNELRKGDHSLELETDSVRKSHRRKQIFSYKTYSLRSQSETPKSEAVTVQNVWELAKSPAYQPLVVLEPLRIVRPQQRDLLRHRQRSTSRHRKCRIFGPRQRSVSVERPVEREIRLEGGRSRREQFIIKDKPKQRRTCCITPPSRVKHSPVQTRSRSSSEKSCKLPVKSDDAHNSLRNKNRPKGCKYASCQTPKSSEKCSSVRTRSHTRSLTPCKLPAQTAETINGRSSSVLNTSNVLHAQNRNFSDMTMPAKPLHSNEVFYNRTASSMSSSTDTTCTTPRSDETDEEWIVHEDFIGDTMATISEDTYFSDEIDMDVVVEEGDIQDTIAKMAELRGYEKCENKMMTIERPVLPLSAASSEISNDNDDSSNSVVSSFLMQNSFNKDSSPSFSSSSPPSPSLSASSPSPSFSPSPECVSPQSSPSLALRPFSFPAQSALSCSSPEHVDVPSLSNPTSQSFSVDPTSSLKSNSLTSSIAVMPFKSKNLVSCTSEKNLPSRLPSLPEPSESESASIPLSRFPSPRRSLRYSHTSVPSYNNRSMKKGLLDTYNPLCVRRSSPPPIFPKRNGSLTEMEYRIKARALTARKFVPMSRVAIEQREMVRQLQTLQEKQ